MYSRLNIFGIILFYSLLFTRLFISSNYPISKNEKTGWIILLFGILFIKFYYQKTLKKKVTIKKYSNKSFCVFLDTNAFNKKLSKLNGKWENNLHGNRKGWVFHNSDYNKVSSILFNE